MKKLKPGVGIITGGVGELIDSAIMVSFNITLDELTYIAANATDDALDRFLAVLDEGTSFSMRRDAILIRDKYLKAYSACPELKKEDTSERSS